MRSDEKKIGSLENFGIAILMILSMVFFPLNPSKAESNQSRSPGDYIFNPRSGYYESFSSDRKITGYVAGCENSPGFQKNIGQFGLIKTRIMGRKDNREALDYSRKASQLDKSLYGVGELFDFGNSCKGEDGTGHCRGTGQLVGSQALVITAAHVFQDKSTKKISDWRGFKFSLKVWIPPELREKSNVEYEWRSYEIEDVYFGSLDLFEFSDRDFAFVKLKEPVGKYISRQGKNGPIGPTVEVDDSKLVPFLPFQKLNSDKVNLKAMTAGFQFDKRGGAYKNDEYFRIYADPAMPNFLAWDGDSQDHSSGSAIAVKTNEGLVFAGINIGYVGDDQVKGNFDLTSRFNYALDGNSFYDEFTEYRRRFRSEDVTSRGNGIDVQGI